MKVRDLDTDVRIQLGRGSYMPVLMKLVAMTTGPIVELGCGYVSTPYLHWACFSTKRPLVSYEDHPEWYGFASRFACDFHTVHHVTDWDALDFSGPCSVAFVDHNNHRRKLDIPRLAHAEYVVIHDTENAEDRKYRMGRPILQYQYRLKYHEAGGPATSVVSNVHDLSGVIV
jgi:hypothetical protein